MPSTRLKARRSPFVPLEKQDGAKHCERLIREHLLA